MDKRDHIIKLFNGYIENRLTEAELETLLNYFGLERDQDTLRDLILDELNQLSLSADDPLEISRIIKIADDKLTKRIVRIEYIRRINNFSIIAACILMFIIVAFAVSNIIHKSASPKSEKNLTRLTDIPSGGNRATLTLADGQKINLDSTQSSITVGAQIHYSNGSRIKTADYISSGISCNTLTTAKGGQYQIILPDGTKVWLNAQSTLTYPSEFSGNSRRVEISGEAYFAVSQHEKQPFEVITNGQEIQVIGTEFNVSSYADEETVRTTLVKGAVKICLNDDQLGSNHIKGNGIFLVPGEQARLKDRVLSKSKTDITAAIAWKEGDFYFKNTPLVDMMKQIARWYNIEVIYLRHIPYDSFSGEIERSLSLLSVLEFLKRSGISYHLEGKKLYIH